MNTIYVLVNLIFWALIGYAVGCVVDIYYATRLFL